MENLIVPCESKPPIEHLFKHEPPTEFSPKSIKPTICLTKKSRLLSSEPAQKITELYLNHLCRQGRLKEAISALDSIAARGSKVRPNTYISLLQSCIDSDSIDQGRKLHARIDLVQGPNSFVETKLVSMYAKCGSLDDARLVFVEMRERNLFTWSAMIGGYAREQRWKEIIELFFEMMAEGIIPDEFLFPKILQACGNSRDAETGKLVHSLAIRGGLDLCLHVNNSLLTMYAKCGRLSSARRFFEKMAKKDRVTWNSIISGYCQSGKNDEAHILFNQMQGKGIEPGLITWNILISSYNQSGNCDLARELMNKMETLGITPDVFTWTSMISGFSQNNKTNQALELFREMLLAGVEPNGVSIASAVSACASLKALKKGKELHSIGVKRGSMGDLLLGNSLIDMYSKCGKLEAARRVFDKILEKDVFTWNSMIGGYAHTGYCGKAYDLFMKMQASHTQPNVVTWNTMISGYIQNGDEDQALDLFQRMEIDGRVKRNVASWNALIAGSLQNNQKNSALGIFRQMQAFGVRPNSVTVLSILPACANLIAAKKVKELHGCVLRRNLESELSVSNSLLDSYAKAGYMVCARAIFDGMLTKDLISWNSLIGGYVLHGYPDIALALFDQMRKVGLKPNRGTFVSVILSYSLIRKVNEGKWSFSSMSEDFQITPALEHYSAMVDLFGRSGRLLEAAEFIEGMPLDPNSAIWDALLTACRVHGDIKLAALAAERLFELEPGNSVVYKILLKIYALCGRSLDALKARKPLKRNETGNSLGRSWIEVDNTVHSFITGDQSILNSGALYSQLDSITKRIKVMELDSYDKQLHIEEEEEENIYGVHGEKLAIAFAIMCSPYVSRTIRIVKNLRMCRDCHRSFKLISLMYGREIYLKDSKCLHHFKNGLCSCRDYW